MSLNSLVHVDVCCFLILYILHPLSTPRKAMQYVCMYLLCYHAIYAWAPYSNWDWLQIRTHFFVIKLFCYLHYVQICLESTSNRVPNLCGFGLVDAHFGES